MTSSDAMAEPNRRICHNTKYAIKVESGDNCDRFWSEPDGKQKYNQESKKTCEDFSENVLKLPKGEDVCFKMATSKDTRHNSCTKYQNWWGGGWRRHWRAYSRCTYGIQKLSKSTGSTSTNVCNTASCSVAIQYALTENVSYAQSVGTSTTYSLSAGLEGFPIRVGIDKNKMKSSTTGNSYGTFTSIAKGCTYTRGTYLVWKVSIQPTNIAPIQSDIYLECSDYFANGGKVPLSNTKSISKSKKSKLKRQLKRRKKIRIGKVRKGKIYSYPKKKRKVVFSRTYRKKY